MNNAAALICCALLGWPGEAETRFEQVFPAQKSKETVERSPNQYRAVVLLHGLRLQPFSSIRVHQAHLHDWQLPQSHLVQSFGKHADVYCFSYAQNTPLDNICEHAGLAVAVRKLNFLGYAEIILVGHSAGGVIARIFVEDNPHCGVTRVVQICSPNLGSSWAKVDFTVRRDQEPFLHSLTRNERALCCQKRGDRRVPEHVEFLCIVGATGPLGDGLVSVQSQWPDDLQSQGIPALRLATTHFTVMHSRKTLDKIIELSLQNHPRLTTDIEKLARKRLVLGGSGS